MIKTISIFDLMEVSQIRDCILSGDKETFDKHLYYLGIDTNKQVFESEHYHRPMFSGTEVKFGLLYSGTERTDSEYLKNGSSLENRIEQCANGDIDLLNMLNDLSSQPNFGGMMCEHARGNITAYEGMESVSEGN